MDTPEGESRLPSGAAKKKGQHTPAATCAEQTTRALRDAATCQRGLLYYYSTVASLISSGVFPPSAFLPPGLFPPGLCSHLCEKRATRPPVTEVSHIRAAQCFATDSSTVKYVGNVLRVQPGSLMMTGTPPHAMSENVIAMRWSSYVSMATSGLTTLGGVMTQ
jgi:hypothetical protein